MTSLTVGVISAGCICGGAVVGFALQRVLPKQHLSKEAQDMIKLAVGVIATSTALVLGLLVSSSKSQFDAMGSRLVQFGANVIILDNTLAEYGPEAKPAREQLRRGLETTLQQVWPEERTGGSTLAVIEHGVPIDAVRVKLRELKPATDEQRALLAQALQIVSDVSRSRWMLIEDAQRGLPPILLGVLVFWLALLFVSFGLFAPRNVTVTAALFVSACSMAVAIFLVLEMNSPLDGLMKISSAPLRKALEFIGQ
ncbi:MAG TPA: hypothetical protein VEL75_19700 [Candidatus Methylomirabilis sp.]|nr:hypothetical protein [Candidatus Methylomirabilis sp.]